MTQNNKTTLYKERSYAQSLQAAFRFNLYYVKVLLVSLWPVCLAAGIVWTGFMALWRVCSPEGLLILALVAGLLLLYAMAFAREVMTTMLSAYEDGYELKRWAWRGKVGQTLVAALPTFYLLVLENFILLLLIVAAIRLYEVYWAWPILIGVVVWVLLVPYNVSLNQLQFGRKRFGEALKVGWKAAGQGYGGTWAVLFVSILVWALWGTICLLPEGILFMAINASDSAQAYGDASDMPQSVLYLRYIIGTVLFGVVFFSQTLWTLPQYFLYTSGVAKKNKRNK